MGSEVLEKAGIADRATSIERAVLTPEEAAHYCGMTTEQFWAHVREGRCRFVNLANTPARVRTGPRHAGFRRASLDRFLESLEFEFPQQHAAPDPEALPVSPRKRRGKAAEAGGEVAPAKPPRKTWS